MTYNIYVDLAFGWAFIINLLLLYVSERLLENDIRLCRLCTDSLIISMVCTTLYVTLYACSPILQNTLYVTAYLLLLYIFYRLRRKKAPLMLTYVVYILTGIVIGLLLMLISSSMLKGLICILFAVPSVYIIYSYKKQNSLLKTCIHNLELNICGEHFLTDAYMDTGNGLVDLSGQNVMITDCTYALELLGSRYVTLLDTYHLKKSFDYAKANSISDIFFRPVPYRTVCSNFCIMPGFTADSVLHKETGKIYQNITIAISPNRLLLPMDAKLLSNRYLKF